VENELILAFEAWEYVCAISLHGTIYPLSAPFETIGMHPAFPLCLQVIFLVLRWCRLRNAGAVIHTHSTAAVLVTLIYDKTFEIQNQEMIKGVPRGDSRKAGYLGYFDRLVIPIIENTYHLRELAKVVHVRKIWRIDCRRQSKNILRRSPFLSDDMAFMVHPKKLRFILVWGNTWEQCKCITECIDYLCLLAVEMKKMGLDPAEEL
jgi:methylthioribulose-1-phosphate dehydratase